MYKDDGSFLRMEKKATNKVGLVLLFIFLALLIGGGVYFYLNNKDKINFDFSMPWQKSKEVKKKEQEEQKEQKVKAEMDIERKKIDIATEEIYQGDGITIKPTSINFDKSNGYEINLLMSNNNDEGANINIKNILIDGYQTDISLYTYMNALEQKYVSFKLPIEMLDLYRLEQFSGVDLITDIMVGSKKVIENSKLTIDAIESGDNVTKITGLTNLGSSGDVEIKYYKLEEDEDKYKIYLDFKNKNKENDYNIIFRRVDINDTNYEDTSFNVKVVAQGEKIQSFEVSKKDFSEIKKINFSFFIMHNNDIYMTSDKTIKV